MTALRHTGIRVRLTASTVSALAVVLLLYSVAAAAMLRRDLLRQLTRHAIQDLETIEGLLYFNPQGRLLLRDDYHNHPESKQVLERLVQVSAPDGSVLLRNELLGNRPLGGPILPNEGQGGYSERQAVLDGGMRVLLVSRRHSIGDRPVIIRVAFDEAPLEEQFRSGLIALLLPLPFILILAGAGGFFLASRALRPIEEMARKAGEITSEKLHERLPVNIADGELADLAKAFNSVLVRLEQSFEQLRRFTSDASHELRTPLAAMRSVGEVALQKDGGTAACRDAIGSMLEEATHLTRLVDSLLTIARTDAGQVQLNRTVFPALRLAEECAGLFDAVLDEGGQRFVIECKVNDSLDGDWLLLRQALINVLHNAIKYTPRSGNIWLRILGEGEQLIFEVEDAGPGIPEEALARVFDRFYRVEASRSRQSGGAGLGLSIAKWNITVHGGAITALRGSVGGCLMRISLPRLAGPR